MKKAVGMLVHPASEKQSSLLSRFIAPRRGGIGSVPGLDIDAGAAVGDAIFREFGLDQFVGCTTAETYKRPLPHVFETKEVKALTDLYIDWAPYIFSRIMSDLVAPIQTFNKTSRLGWDSFEVLDNKMDRLGPLISRVRRGDSGVYSEFLSSFVIMNVRLQAEAKTKSRDFIYLSDEFQPYHETVGEPQRTVEVASIGRRVASRVRPVYNMPMLNLVKQVLDTAIHNVFLAYPAFHHDMFNGRLLPVTGQHLCIDVKHFERHTAMLVRARAQLLGGAYAKIGTVFEQIPFCCPTDSRKRFAFIYPDRKNGFSEQFASGDSAVAPAQKEVFLALYAEYFRQTRQLDRSSAIELVLQGGDNRLTIRNYGDDNSLSGDPGELKAVFEFLKSYLHVEEEKPPKFLGFEFGSPTAEEGVRPRWYLPVSSYLTKTYLNERRPFSNFRKYPYLGWVLKREVFSRLGDPRVAKEVFPFEDNLLAKHGLPWTTVLRNAENERAKSLAQPTTTDANWLMGKDYLMTAEEKIKSGEFFGMMPDQTAPLIKVLLGEEWQKQIKKTL